MNADQFLQVANHFSDAALLLTPEGKVLAANRGLSDLGFQPAALAGRLLSELIATPNGLMDYLRRCTQSAEPVVGSLVLRNAAGQEVPCRCYGSLARLASQDAHAPIVLRLVADSVASPAVSALHERLEALTQALLQKEEAEGELRQTVERHRLMAEHLTALVEASATLTGTLERSAVLTRILELSSRLLPADAYAIWRFHPTLEQWQVAVASGLSEAYQHDTIRVLEQTPSMPDSAVIAADVYQLPMLAERKELYRAEGIRALLAVPLRIHGQIRGTLVVYHRQPHAFSEVEVGVATAVANLAAATLGSADLYEEQARLHAETHEHRESLRVTLASIGDAVIATDTAAQVTFLNPMAETLTGWSRADAQGRGVEQVFSIIREESGQRLENPVTRVLRDNTTVGMANHTMLIARDGRQVPIEQSAAPIRDGQGRVVGAVLVFRDNSYRRRAERLRRTRLAVTQTLAETNSIAAALPRILQAVCDNLGWDIGVFWQATDGGRHVHCLHVYHRPGTDASEFETLTRRSTFQGDEGLPGRVLASRRPVWVEDVLRDTNFPRADVAARAGLRGAFACPVYRDNTILGVVEFFSHEIREPDPDLLEMVASLGGQVGQFIERQQAEAALREEARTTQTLQRIGTALSAERELQNIVQMVTDEATSLTGAQFGAFFYNVLNERGESYLLYTLSGVPRAMFERFPMPRNSSVFDPTFRGEGVVRLDDVTRDPRYGKNPPYYGMPPGHLPVRSYLAVPVVSRSGTVLGGLFFGHGEPGVFTERAERLVVGIAAQAAVAIDNARLNRQVLESEERFRQLAENINDVFWLEDPSGPRLLYVSPAYEVIWGQSRQRLYQDPRAYLDAVVPADREKAVSWLTQPFRGVAAAEEYRITRPDGSVRWIRDRGFPIKDEVGQVYRIAGIAEDITERKRAEQDARFLADASAALAGLVDYESTLQKVARLSVPFFADWCTVDMLDDNDTLRRLAVAHIDVSKVELAHELNRRYPPDPTAPQGVWNIIRTGKSEIIPEITEELIAATVPDPALRDILRELGLRSYMGVPLTVRGRVLGVLTFIAAESGRRYDAADLALAEDLAHRAAVAIENARLYQAVREADRRKDEFLALLGHELRNPLAPVRNGLHVLKMPGANPAVVERAREMMERQVEHLVRLVDDLLDVSRIMRGKVELRREPLELATVLARAVEISQPALDAEGHQLTITVPPAPLWVHGDLVRLAQVVSNLLHNAAKYTERGGQIMLTAAREGNEGVVRVRDTGIGIAPELLPRLFDMFFQAERRTKESQGGLGIGLALVRRLVELHGGTVEAHSAGQGMGSEFVIRLPLLGMDTTAVEQLGDHDADAALPVQRVLVVDDNVDAADSLAMLLRLQGQEVQVAYDGPSALALARAQPPDIAFLDLGMPKMDGYDVAREFRFDPALRDAVLVALTGWGQPEDRQRTRAAGFDHHLVKPVDGDTLRTLITHQR